jgi:hypothetical protein
MRTSNFCGILVACAAGYVGGLLASHSSVRAAPPEVVRAARFELVNGAGTRVASWEVDSNGGARMRFFYKGDLVGADIGVLPDGRPFLRMDGRDGKNRISLDLDQADKPIFVMSDERWEGRVHLGFMPPDTFPYSDWDHWGLLFRAFGSERPVVGMGMINTRNNPAEPFLRVAGRSVR